MKLFIFKPSRFWGYCGGMIVVTANTFEAATKRILDKAAEEEDVGDVKFVVEDFAKEPGDCQGVNTWVLFKEIEVAHDVDLLEIEFNYA